MTAATAAPSLGWTHLSVGWSNSCGIRADGTLWCWGFNSSIPIQQAGTRWTQVSAGSLHACGLRDDGSLWCWGNNIDGALGLGEWALGGSAPTRVGTDRWRGVAAGDYYTCATRVDHTLWCWGTSSSGALGLGAGIAIAYTPTRVGAGTSWDKPASRLDSNACALQTDRTLWCWGADYDSQVGVGDMQPHWFPTRIPGHGWTYAAVGFGACGLKRDHTLWCWGMPVSASSSTIPTSPAQVAGRWLQVALGGENCGIQVDHSLWCWGWDSDGLLGPAEPPSWHPPTRVGNWRWREVSTSFFDTCAIRADSSLLCWDGNSWGMPGAPSST